MQYWLVKSEPDEFSIDDLQHRQLEPWTGVRNYEARNFMRDKMKPGDQVLFYHSSTAIPAVVGIAEVISPPYADPTQFDKNSRYYDAKSTPENPRWQLVDIGYIRHLPNIVPLKTIKQHDALQEMLLVKRSRLSVIPVTQHEFETILQLSESQ